jgi:PAS domain S-box-containing protein
LSGSELDGAQASASATFADVTQLPPAADQQRLLATVLMDSNDAVAVHDFSGAITAWNRGAERTYGYSEAEALTMNVQHLLPADRKAPYQLLLERLRRGEEVSSLETRRLCKDGRVLEVWLTLTTLCDEQGRPTAVACTERDITESVRARAELERRVAERTGQLDSANRSLQSEILDRRKAQQALHETSGRLAAIVSYASEGIVTIDEHGNIDSYNRAAREMFGYEPGEVIGQNIKMLMPFPFREEHDSHIRRYLTTGVKRIIGIRREVVGRRKDGTVFPMELGVSEVREGARRIFTGIVRDISERKALEKELLEVAAREQRRIGQDLHDSIGQEITGLSMMSQSLAEGLAASGSPRSEAAAKIARGLRQALKHVRTLSRGLVPVEVDAEGLMAALGELAANTREMHGIRCVFECPEPVLVEDNSAATQLFRIAQEAVTNSLKHSRGRAIAIELVAAGPRLTLRVRDDGTGLPDRVEAVKGMGLKIMRYRARLIDGHLTVLPAEGGGTVVTCSLVRGTNHESKQD